MPSAPQPDLTVLLDLERLVVRDHQLDLQDRLDP